MCGLILKFEKDFYLIMKIMYFKMKWQLIDLVVVFICIKNKEYGAKILKNPDEENIIKYINT